MEGSVILPKFLKQPKLVKNFRKIWLLFSIFFQILEGYLPPRVYGLVVEWSLKHKDELINNWELLKEGQPVNKIDPLM